MSESPPSRSQRLDHAILTQSALGRLGWKPPSANDLLTNTPPGLAHLPVLDGDASLALSQPASAVEPTGSTQRDRDPSSRRLGRRRNAISNLRAATGTQRSSESPARTRRPAAAPPPVDINANNNLVTRFGNFNIRSGAGARPSSRAAPRRTGVSAAAAAAPAAPAPSPASRPSPHVHWPKNNPAVHTAAADDMVRTAEERELLRTKQCYTDRFLCYHASLQQWLLWNRGRRRSLWGQFPIPLHPGGWPGHPPVRPGEELDALLSYQQKLEEKRQAPGGVRGVFNRDVRRPLGRARGLIDRLHRAGLEDYNRRKVNGLQARLVKDFEPAGIRFKRTLGQGGFGAVFLFEMVGGKGSNCPIVVKGSTRELLDDSDALGDEIDNLNWMNGASHFIQRIFLQDLPLPTISRRRRIRLAARKGMAAVRKMARQTGDIVHGIRDAALFRPLQPRQHSLRSVDDGGDEHDQAQPGYTAQEVEEIQQRRAQLDNTRNLIMLENMPRGDIQELINKLVKKKLRLSNRALWAIFECLFKGCVGMATPGRFHEHGQDVNAHAMEEQDETVPDWLRDGTQKPAWPMVHFDLDPQNALVGNFEAGGPHENVPIIKIADPGLAVIMDDNVRNNEATLWNMRCRGKAQYLQPEQFTREWEYRAALDLAHLSMESTAGNYNWWGNLYHIGWIMWSLVTQCFPPVPPRALPYTYASEEDPLSAEEFVVNGHTYGMHVMAAEFDDCDLELRRQILRCLDHDPTRRPNMGWFEAVLAFNVGRPDLVEAESDEELREHINTIYGQPAFARK